MKIGIALLSLAMGCSGWMRPASYASELEACLTMTTCEGYRACRKEVAFRYNQPYSGTCGAGQ